MSTAVTVEDRIQRVGVSDETTTAYLADVDGAAGMFHGIPAHRSRGADSERQQYGHHDRSPANDFALRRVTRGRIPPSVHRALAGWAWVRRARTCSSVQHCAAWAVVFVALLPVEGHAQGFQRPEQFITLSIGAGRTSINPPDFVWIDEKFPAGLVLPRRDNGGLLEISVGAMVANRVAIVGGVELLGGSEEVRLANFHFYGGVRTWLAKRLWVEGGLGPTWSNVFAGEGEEQRDSGKWGFGGVGVVGYDLLQRRNASFLIRGHFMAHVQARVSTNAAAGVRANTLALLLGFATGW